MALHAGIFVAQASDKVASFRRATFRRAGFREQACFRYCSDKQMNVQAVPTWDKQASCEQASMSELRGSCETQKLTRAQAHHRPTFTLAQQVHIGAGHIGVPHSFSSVFTSARFSLVQALEHRLDRCATR